MPALAKRPCYLIAGALFLAANGWDFTSQAHVGRALSMSLARPATPDGRLRWEQARSRHLDRATIARCVGLGFAFLALAAWLASRIRREGGRQDVPSLLLLWYVVSLLILI